MKTVLIGLALLAAVPMLRAAEPEGFALWKRDAIQKTGKDLAAKIDAQKFAFKEFGNYGNHMIGLSHREADGGAEVHETQVDIFIVESGKATLIVGGTLLEPKTVKPNEIRGTGLEGGTTSVLTAGDIVHIPAKVPHQLKIAAGTAFNYTVIKVDTK